MSRIKADTSSIYNCGSELQSYASQYADYYNSIISLSRELHAYWRGEDYDAFVKNVEALRSSWEKMYKLLDGAGDAVKTSANRYDDASDRVASRACSI